jgi:hypothetical protein
MITEKNKKISIWHNSVTWFFVFLLVGCFLFGKNVLAYTGDYNKAINGSLSASEWNNLINDFVSIAANGNVGIGTTAPAAKLDIWGNLRADSGNFTTDGSGNLTVESIFDKTNVLYKLDPSSSGTSLNVAGSIFSTGGIIGTLGAGNNYFMGNVGIGTNNPTQKLEVIGSILGTNIYAPGIDNFKQNGSLVNKVIGPDSSQVAQSPISGFIWHDILAFNKNAIPVFETSVDGGSWASSTLDKRLFSHIENQTIGILNAASLKAIRWTWSSGVSWSQAQWLNIAYSYSSVPVNATITVDSSADGSSWTNRHTSTFTGNAAPFWLYVSPFNGDTYLRVTITSNASSGSLNLSSIRLLTSRWGDQGLGSEMSYPYSWDENRNVYFSGNIGIGTTNSTSAKLVVTPSGTYSIDAGAGRIGNLGTPALDTDAATVGYVKSIAAGTSSVPTVGYWTASGLNIYSANAGNVGIGTTNPGAKLHIEGTSTGGIQSQIINLSAADGAYSSFFLKTGTQTGFEFYKYNAANSTYPNGVGINNYDAGAMYFSTSNTPRLFIQPGGNVGIGTTSPVAALDIFSKVKITSGGTIYNTDNSRYLDMSGTLSDSLKVSGDIYTTAGLFKSDNTTGSNYLLGNLGIGTATPAAGTRLDVNGLIKMRIASTSITQAEDVVNKDYVDNKIVTVVNGINTTAKYYGVTTAAYYGNNVIFGTGYATSTGYIAANDICNNSWTGTHVCTTGEILNTINTRNPMPTESIVWIFNGPPGYTVEANDCDGRSSNRSTSYGAVWQASTTTWKNGRGMITACSSYNKFACCK